jgi:HSF-type DNA-binding
MRLGIASTTSGRQTEEMATNDDRAAEACKGVPNYRDFSQVTASDDDAIQPLLDIGMGGDRGAGGRQDMHVSNRNFPVKLHFMLQDVEEEGLTHIVSWAPHGRSFMVHRMNDFVEIVLARYVRIPVVLARARTFRGSRLPSSRAFLDPASWFRQTKIASFQRQLNIYGFQRISYGKYALDLPLLGYYGSWLRFF